MLKISGLNRKRRFDNKKVRQCLLCLSTTGISGGRKNEGYTKDRHETATELITGGVAPWTCGSNEEYQVCQVDLQLTKERLFVHAAESMAAEKILIVCDRGILDNKAYMTEAEFLAVQRALCEAEVGRVEG